MGIIFSSVLYLLHMTHAHGRFQRPSQPGNVDGRLLAGIEQLMGRAVRNMKDSSATEIITLAVQHQEPLASLNVDRLFAMEVLTGMPAWRDLRLHEKTAACRESRLRRNHQRCLVVLARAHPAQFFPPDHPRCVRHDPLNTLRLSQPIVLEIFHHSSNPLPMIKYLE